MARPQADDYDLRKQKILDRASKLFADDGYHKASMSEIARACEMSKSLIYHYYSSKQEILYHAMIDHVKELDKLAKEVMAESLPAEESLRKIIRRYHEVWTGAGGTPGRPRGRRIGRRLVARRIIGPREHIREQCGEDDSVRL